MTYDPNNKNPKKSNDNVMKNYASSQVDVRTKIKYEAMLLNWHVETLLQVCPYLLDELYKIKESKIQEEQFEDLDDHSYIWKNYIPFD
jgi:hypothetical protein